MPKDVHHNFFLNSAKHLGKTFVSKQRSHKMPNPCKDFEVVEYLYPIPPLNTKLKKNPTSLNHGL